MVLYRKDGKYQHIPPYKQIHVHLGFVWISIWCTSIHTRHSCLKL